ncbi:MAG: nitroreductase [Chloroflexota bacterium]
MDLAEGILTRRSIRGFKPTPIPEETLKRILELASRSPSYTNTQPWEVTVVTSKKKEELSRVLLGLADAETPTKNDIPTPTSWPEELGRRSREHGAKRFKAIGVEREDTKTRKEMRLANFMFYGAPCAMFLYMDSTLSGYSIFDMGLFAQTLILAAHSLGVESCLQAALTGYPDAVREFLGLPETKKIVIGISLGYPDPDARINSYHSERVGTDAFVKWFK